MLKKSALSLFSILIFSRFDSHKNSTESVMKIGKLIVCLAFIIYVLIGCNCTINHQKIESKKSENKISPEIKEETLREVVWYNDDFKLKMPCEIGKDESDKSSAIAARETTEIHKCESGNLVFAVTSKKSRDDLKEQFENERKKENSEIIKTKDFVYFDTSKSINRVTTKGKGEFSLPEYQDIAIRTRFHLINNKWMINFEITCSVGQKDICQKLLISNEHPKIKEFFDSLSINK